MKNNSKNLSKKPWKVEKKKKPWVKITLLVITLVLLVTGVLVGCALIKDPDRIEHKSEEAIILEEFIEIGEDNLSPDTISEKALSFVALYAGKDPSKVTAEDIKEVYEALKSGKSLLFDVGENKNKDTVTRKDKFYNILVIGRDKVALNTDVIICASFDTANKKAATVQIPRDSYVEDAKGVKSKINAVFARGYTETKKELQNLKKSAAGKTDEQIQQLCNKSSIDITPDELKAYMSGKKKLDDICTEKGIKALQDVITRTFGIYFDYYAIVSTDAFVQIVDAIGGVDVYVQEPMHYEDPLQNLYIHIDAGQQHLDGKKAEGFVRFRSGYVQADIARMDAQKIFMTSFFKKLLSFSSITKIDEIVNAVYKNLDTDMSLENILAFVRPALGVDMSEITMLNIQGVAYNKGMYYALNKAENLKIVNQYFNVFSHDLKENAVNVVELVKDFSDTQYEGMTMEDIKDKQPHINFIHPPVSKPEDEEKTESETETEAETETEEPNLPDGETEEPSDGEEDENTDEKENEDENLKDEEKSEEKADEDESESEDPTQNPDEPKEDKPEDKEIKEEIKDEPKEESKKDSKEENSSEGKTKEPSENEEIVLPEEDGKEE